MDIQNLRAFITVAEKKSFSRTAESLNLTQPAVSKRIAALENELSSKLFDRMGRTVNLTEAGRVLLPSALKIYSEVSRIEGEICSLGSEVKGKLSIGLEEHVAVDRLAPLLKAFRENYPDVVLDMQFTSTEDTLTKIECGVLDLGLCTVDSNYLHDKSLARLRSIELWHDPMVVAVAKSHPAAVLRSVSITELAKYPAILPKIGTSLRQSINHAFQECEATVPMCMEMQGYSVTRSMVAIGLGWAFLPESELGDSLVKLEVVGANNEALRLDHSVGLIRNPNLSLSRASKAFLDDLKVRFQ